MLSADKVSEIFCIADDFCQEYDHQIEEISLPDERNIVGERARCPTAR